MPLSFWRGGTRVTQSLGSIWATTSGQSLIGKNVNNPNLDLMNFTNSQLLQLLGTRFPGLSRPITFDPAGLGIGNSGPFQNTRGYFSDATFVPSPDYWDINGTLRHRFTLTDSAIASGGLPGTIGTGSETIVSQPLKPDQRIYFEVHMNKYPKQVDAGGNQAPFYQNGIVMDISSPGSGSVPYWGSGTGSRHNGGFLDSGLGGDIEIAIAPEGWVSSGDFETAIGRMAGIVTKSIQSTNWYNVTQPISANFASKINIHPENDSDLTGINNGDIFMFAIDGVQDSTTTDNAFYFGKNGVWAKADSDNPNFGSLVQSWDPADDSTGARGGWALEPSEDPYHVYISPIWDASAKDSAAGTTLGTYKYMDIDITIKTGTDCTYSPPTSGRGHIFKAH